MQALQIILAFSLLYGLYSWREAQVIATAVGITINLLWQIGLFYAVRKEKQRLETQLEIEINNMAASSEIPSVLMFNSDQVQTSTTLDERRSK